MVTIDSLWKLAITYPTVPPPTPYVEPFSHNTRIAYKRQTDRPTHRAKDST